MAKPIIVRDQSGRRLQTFGEAPQSLLAIQNNWQLLRSAAVQRMLSFRPGQTAATQFKNGSGWQRVSGDPHLKLDLQPLGYQQIVVRVVAGVSPVSRPVHPRRFS